MPFACDLGRPLWKLAQTHTQTQEQRIITLCKCFSYICTRYFDYFREAAKHLHHFIVTFEEGKKRRIQTIFFLPVLFYSHVIIIHCTLYLVLFFSYFHFMLLCHCPLNEFIPFEYMQPLKLTLLHSECVPMNGHSIFFSFYAFIQTSGPVCRNRMMCRTKDRKKKHILISADTFFRIRNYLYSYNRYEYIRTYTVQFTYCSVRAYLSWT